MLCYKHNVGGRLVSVPAEGSVIQQMQGDWAFPGLYRPEKAGDMVEFCAHLARKAFSIASSWPY